MLKKQKDNAVINKPIGLTMGDAAGIGPELIVKLFHEGLPAPALIYGDRCSLERAARFCGLPSPDIVEYTGPQEVLSSWSPHRIFLKQANIRFDETLVLGQVSAQAGEGSFQYLSQAIDDATQGKIDAIVTAPLHKVSLKKAGHDFPGHTEILAEKSGVDNVGMMLLNEELRVILVSIHLGLAQVPTFITPEREEKTIRLAQKACQDLGISYPRIAVAGLNPHAGEEGRFGHEEKDIILPVIEKLQAEGLNVSGPYAGDTIFMRARKGEFDIVVAQYHDQGLIPIKYLGVDTGVNVTVGLPFIRTSVDHGTAFDIAGQGKADPSSLREAFLLAMKMQIAKQQNNS